MGSTILVQCGVLVINLRLKMIRNSIIGKLWISIVALIVIVLVLLSLGLSGLLEDFYYSRISEELVAHGQQVAQVIGTATDSEQLTEQLDL